ncbi:MAG TPA: Maf-like protein [Alphaproteobacteria bacterium]|nr:Maf-like protein [Alphaproteobacteria bacterium]
MAENTIVLASASPARAGMLAAAGVPFAADPAAVDEASVKRAMKADGAAADAVAEALAALKAQQVARRHPGLLVVGADQMLVCGGRWFDKPGDAAEAREQLLALRGRTHELVTAAVVVRDAEVLWHHVELARLTVRPFTEAFLDFYLDAMGGHVRRSVGGYAVEGLGAQLFSRIEGSHYAVLGLPLLPLLDFLRGHGVIPE